MPLLNPDESVIAVLSIGGEKDQVEPHFDAYRKMLQDAADKLLERLKNM